jgi:exopolysaccharide biosynthesis WecB/TagA/CpsF family protein
MPAATPARIPFLGLDFDPLDVSASAAAIAARARRQSSLAYVVTPNVDHLVRLDREQTLRDIYRGAWLNLCDSRILESLASASGLGLPVAPGADIVEALFHDHVGSEDPIVIIGGSLDMVRDLRARFHLQDVRWFDAAPGLRSSPAARAACVDFIRTNPAMYVFIAVGSPQQEMIAHEAARLGGASGVAICCGASLDFLSGRKARAPQWMRRARLEWLHRLGAEPSRMWRRYLVDGPRIVGLWGRWRLDPPSG